VQNDARSMRRNDDDDENDDDDAGETTVVVLAKRSSRDDRRDAIVRAGCLWRREARRRADGVRRRGRDDEVRHGLGQGKMDCAERGYVQVGTFRYEREK